VTGGPRPEEIEVKIPAADLDAVRHRLEQMGGNRTRERHEESNDLYDHADGRLSSAGCSLRLRRTPGESRVTFKGRARFEGGVKTREERETTVGNAGEAEAILLRLGFVRSFRYEKRREEWQLFGCAVALDETPIGHFVEVEGDPVAIRKAVVALELDFAAAIPYSYARLYALKRKDEPARSPDMTFPPTS
jgi:adenylate cyclase class 2